MLVNIATKDGGTKPVDLNRRRAIRERCLNCSAWSYKEVEFCEFTDCSLYPFRTGQGKQDAQKRKKAIRQYCMWCTCDQPKEIRLCPSTDCPLYAYRIRVVDRSIEIHTSSKKEQIGAGFEEKNKAKCHTLPKNNMSFFRSYTGASQRNL